VAKRSIEKFCSCYEVLQLGHCRGPVEHDEATVGSGDETLGVDMFQCLSQPGTDLIYRLDAGPRDSDDPQDDFCRAKAFEKYQVVVPVGILYRNRVDRGVLDRIGQREVGLLIGFGIVLLVKLDRIAATDMNNPINRR